MNRPGVGVSATCSSANHRPPPPLSVGRRFHPSTQVNDGGFIWTSNDQGLTWVASNSTVGAEAWSSGMVFNG